MKTKNYLSPTDMKRRKQMQRKYKHTTDSLTSKNKSVVIDILEKDIYIHTRSLLVGSPHMDALSLASIFFA